MGSTSVEAGRQRPTPLEPADRAFDDVAPAVTGLVEVLLARLVLPRRDHRFDVPPPQPAADPGEAVGLVARLPLRPGRPAGPARPPRPAVDLLEPLGLMALALGHPHGQDVAPAVTDQVGLGAEAALRTPQRMAFGFRALHRRGAAQGGPRVGIFFPPRRRPGGRG